MFMKIHCKYKTNCLHFCSLFYLSIRSNFLPHRTFDDTVYWLCIINCLALPCSYWDTFLGESIAFKKPPLSNFEKLLIWNTAHIFCVNKYPHNTLFISSMSLFCVIVCQYQCQCTYVSMLQDSSLGEWICVLAVCYHWKNESTFLVPL